MDCSLLSLKWNHHNLTFQHVLSKIRSKVLYSDVTLACGGKLYPVHKLVLSTCSDYFEVMLQETHCKHPIIVLKDINCTDLDYLLDFMYIGEVNVPQTKLSGLIEAAECLKIRGLAVPDELDQDTTSKHSLVRNEKSNVNSQLRTKRQREGSPEASQRKGHRPNDHGIPSKGSCGKSDDNSHKTLGTSLIVQEDIGHTEESSFERVHIKHTSTTSSDMELVPVTIKEEFFSSAPQNCISASENEMIEDVRRSQKKAECNTLTDTDGSDENHRHHESPALDHSSLGFKEDVSQEYHDLPNNYVDNLDEERSNSQQLDSCFGGSDVHHPSEEQSVVGRYSQLQGVPSESGQWLEECPVIPLNDGPIKDCPVMSSSISRASFAPVGSASIEKQLVESVSGVVPGSSSNTNVSSVHGTSLMLTEGLSYSSDVEGAASFVVRGTGVQTVKQCSLCFYVTRRMSSMKQHLLTHTGHKPFACPYCSYRSTQKGTLRRHVNGHLKNVHNGNNMSVSQA